MSCITRRLYDSRVSVSWRAPDSTTPDILPFLLKGVRSHTTQLSKHIEEVFDERETKRKNSIPPGDTIIVSFHSLSVLENTFRKKKSGSGINEKTEKSRQRGFLWNYFFLHLTFTARSLKDDGVHFLLIGELFIDWNSLNIMLILFGMTSVFLSNFCHNVIVTPKRLNKCSRVATKFNMSDL